MTTINREIHLAAYAEGWPKESDFTLAETPMPTIDDKQCLIRNLYMSVDPYMRGRMRDIPSYIPPFQIGKPLEGTAVGRVIESKHPDFAEGDLVLSMQGWREYFASDGRGLQKVPETAAPISTYLGVLGMPGLTAWVGLLDIGKPKKGETLLVSAAAGAVGSVVGQIGKIHGCRVVGSAGSDAKVKHLIDDLGFDAAFNYKTEKLSDALDRTCPDNIDIYFENVGGDMLQAALDKMNLFGRIPVCGMISQYNNETPQPGPSNLAYIIGKRILLQGFIVSDSMQRTPEFIAEMGQWLAEGKVRYRETMVKGVDKAPGAFLGMLRGENIGKMVVDLTGEA